MHFEEGDSTCHTIININTRNDKRTRIGDTEGAGRCIDNIDV